MKQQTFYRIAFALLFLCCGGLSASAQSTHSLMSAQIPFEFQVNKKVLPAGRYEVKRDPLRPQLLLIQSRERKAGAGVLVATLDRAQELTQSRLIFKEYGGKRFLAGVWSRELALKYALPVSKTERKLRHLAEAITINAIPDGSPAHN